MYIREDKDDGKKKRHFSVQPVCRDPYAPPFQDEILRRITTLRRNWSDEWDGDEKTSTKFFSCYCRPLLSFSFLFFFLCYIVQTGTKLFL